MLEYCGVDENASPLLKRLIFEVLYVVLLRL